MIYGACARYQTAILVKIIFAILEFIGLVIVTIYVILAIASNSEFDGNEPILVIIFFILTIGIVIFEISTIIVDFLARKEI